MGSWVKGDTIYSTRRLGRRICPGGNADFIFGHDKIKGLPVSHPDRERSGPQENGFRVEKDLRTINAIIIIIVIFFMLLL